ncbi:hypothetical protein [Flavobacterium sp. H122]|uniref:hypothetical protein n=1 Tax=Flavobacterium sp. H122 TaxID=2529860 RepID=UPI0010AA351E|nr:hypothetical protein [Flavobacterium sp. H122]
MDFNDIQSAWNNEQNNEVKIPQNLDKIKAANTPLDKIKKNLRNEFIYQILSMILIGLAPLMKSFPVNAVVPFYLFYSIFTAVSIYYLVKLFLFYRRLTKTNLNTKDSLYETYFDIRLNMELYKTFGFAITSFLVLFLVGVVLFENGNSVNFFTGKLKNAALLALFFNIVFVFLFMGLALEWWVHKFYGKYAKEIRKVIDELKE